MFPRRHFPRVALAGLLLILLCAGSSPAGASPLPPGVAANTNILLANHSLSAVQPSPYVLVSWNDLGMHCYNRDFSSLGVLPPYNTLWAQVIQRGDPPTIVTSGIRVEYSFPDNTYSVNGPNGVNKSNFWQYAQQLFKLPTPLAPNVGLTGKGLAGTMDLQGDHFTAVGIPLTEFSDSTVALDPGNPGAWSRQPYQLARVVVKGTGGTVLTQNDIVAPVSTEMHCDNCHSDGQRNGIATGNVETNILTLHDLEAGTQLMSNQPVLCASCHSSNALGTAGQPGLPSLSNAMHSKHTEANIPNTTDGCYNCHPGPTTRCLRDTMSLNFGFTCETCHGTLLQVSQNPSPWLHEPRCDNSGCHPAAKYGLDQPLYRNSRGIPTTTGTTGHGGLYCEACHDSTHAIATSREPNDAIKFVNLQGHAGTLRECTVCHTAPVWGMIHGPQFSGVPLRTYLPVVMR